MPTEVIKEQLSKWVSCDTIAEAIIEELESEDLEVTLELAQECWLSFLMCELHHGLQTRAQVIADHRPEDE